jgi:hypothetical protein
MRAELVFSRRREIIQSLYTKAFARRREFADEVSKVEQKLGDKVIRIRHTLDYDSTGDPAVKFRVVMPDSSLTKDKLLEATRYVSFVIE